jgi:hypothetical protein
MAAWSGYGEGEGRGERALRIERIRDSLDRGVYRVDGAAVAGKMVAAALCSVRLRGPSALKEEAALFAALEGLRAEFLRNGRVPGVGSPDISPRCAAAPCPPEGSEGGEAATEGRGTGMATVHPMRRRL